MVLKTAVPTVPKMVPQTAVQTVLQKVTGLAPASHPGTKIGFAEALASRSVPRAQEGRICENSSLTI